MSGDDEATRFIQQNSHRIFRIILRIVRNLDDAEELTQDTFMKALRRQDQLKHQEKATHWLSRIATNTAIDFLRRKRCSLVTDSRRTADSLSSPYESAEQSLLRRERWSHLQRGLAQLTTRERTALTLRDLDDMSPEQVAIRMHCATPTIRAHISNARVKFKRYLREEEYGSGYDGREAGVSMPIPVEADWMLILVCAPDRSVETAGVLLLDRNSNQIFMRLKALLNQTDESIRDIWKDVASDLESMARELGGSEVVHWLETTASHTLQVSERHSLKVVDVEKVLQQLFADHVS